MGWDAVDTTLEQACAAGDFPGAVVLVGRGDDVLHHAAIGSRSLYPDRTPMRREIVFDLSSLTKPLATTTAIMLLVGQGKIRLDDRVARFIQNFGVYGKAPVTIRHLLSHASGLAAVRPFHRDIVRIERDGRPNFVATRGARDLVYEAVHRERVEASPGTQATYSDLGFILLGEIIELVTGTTLDRFCHERIFRPLGLRETGFVDLTRLRVEKLAPVTDRIAPTERCPWREQIVCGAVHDDNAYAMGGVAGHAGLFSTAADVHTLARRLIACWRGTDDFVPPAIVRECWTRDERVPQSTWALGWDTPSAVGSSAGRRIGNPAVGHLGFTGTSIWVDLVRDVDIILLTNRVHPTRDNDRIRAVRPRVHDAIFEVLDA